MNGQDRSAANTETSANAENAVGGSNTAAHIEGEPVIEVSEETMARLRYIARKLDCNIPAALEEVLRGFDPKK